MNAVQLANGRSRTAPVRIEPRNTDDHILKCLTDLGRLSYITYVVPSRGLFIVLPPPLELKIRLSDLLLINKETRAS